MGVFLSTLSIEKDFENGALTYVSEVKRLTLVALVVGPLLPPNGSILLTKRLPL